MRNKTILPVRLKCIYSVRPTTVVGLTKRYSSLVAQQAYVLIFVGARFIAPRFGHIPR